jgi:hypothetical protein
MQGQPAQFESIGSRLGLEVVRDDSQTLELVWRGPRFPAFLCLGIALMLFFVSVPIIAALWSRGFTGPAASLWYFPLMNLILLAIALYLITQKRTIVIDGSTRRATVIKRSLRRSVSLSFGFEETARVEIVLDQVYSGFALAGSSATQEFPVPSLRVVLVNGESVLLDRGSRRKLIELAHKISARLDRPLRIDPSIQSEPARQRVPRPASALDKGL